MPRKFRYFPHFGALCLARVQHFYQLYLDILRLSVRVLRKFFTILIRFFLFCGVGLEAILNGFSKRNLIFVVELNDARLWRG